MLRGIKWWIQCKLFKKHRFDYCSGRCIVCHDAECMNFDSAIEQMKAGAIMSYSGGDFDYYYLKNNKLIGTYSCDYEEHEINIGSRERGANWYFISR